MKVLSIEFINELLIKMGKFQKKTKSKFQIKISSDVLNKSIFSVLYSIFYFLFSEF